ncbi:ribosomal RNA processing protein 1 homolog A isoform X2 [Capricornis sumatraensis]|uniref:ribosomal RNA processing protein 1 homolog A isoform X2 n=1 Tax=Capricornis sumatraensis TaxID=34865 RepID=UPI003604EEEE
MGPRVQLPPEIQLAQRLAGNEQVTRDRAVRKLRKYIVARTQRAEGGFTHDELLKVWKGLFYCMWMQDKPLLQEELGRTISQLVHAFQTTEAQHLFLQTFWQTMNREWPGIDRLRLDKFYMLMRMVLREALTALQTQGWDERQTEQLLELLTTEILHPDSEAPNGVKSHFIEIFLEELTKVGAHELTADQNLRLIGPFCTIAAQTQDSLVLHNIAQGIFETIVEQAPLAIEELMNELEEEELSEEEALSEEEVLEEEEAQEPGVLSREPPKGSVCRAQRPLDKQAEDDDEDSASPVLQFDYKAVADRLFEMASRQDTPPQNRKRLYKVVRKLQALAEGLFPEADIPEEAYRNPRGGRRVRMKKRLSGSQLQGKTGRHAKEALRSDLSPGSTRRRRRRRAGGDPAVPRERPGGHGGRGAPRRQRRPQVGAKAKMAGCQEPKAKRKRTPEGQK